MKIIFEVQDTRAAQYGDSHFSKKIQELLGSLGYTIKQKYEGVGIMYSHETLLVNGIEMTFDYNATSFMCYTGGWAKEYVQRKNRFIHIGLGSYKSGKTVVIIHFNKELDTDNLKRKIDKAIEAANNRTKDIQNREEEKATNLTALKKHYEKALAFCESASIHKGVIRMWLKNNNGCLHIDADKNIIKFYIASTPTEIQVGKIDALIDNAAKAVSSVHLMHEQRRCPIPAPFMAEAYENMFYPEQDKF